MNSSTGGRIIRRASLLGLEAFTFKKLAERIGSTEVTVYNYFANKQRLLQYYYQVYWLWLAMHCEQEGRMLKDPYERLWRYPCALRPLDTDHRASQFDVQRLRKLVVNEGAKILPAQERGFGQRAQALQALQGPLCPHCWRGEGLRPAPAHGPVPSPPPWWRCRTRWNSPWSTCLPSPS